MIYLFLLLSTIILYFLLPFLPLQLTKVARLFVALNTLGLSLLYHYVAEAVSVWAAAILIVVLLVLTSYLFFSRFQASEQLQEESVSEIVATESNSHKRYIPIKGETEQKEDLTEEFFLFDENMLEDTSNHETISENETDEDQLNIEEECMEFGDLNDSKVDEKDLLAQGPESIQESELEDEFAFLEEKRVQQNVDKVDVESVKEEEVHSNDKGDRNAVLAELDEDVSDDSFDKLNEAEQLTEEDDENFLNKWGVEAIEELSEEQEEPEEPEEPGELLDESLVSNEEVNEQVVDLSNNNVVELDELLELSENEEGEIVLQDDVEWANTKNVEEVDLDENDEEQTALIVDEEATLEDNEEDEETEIQQEDQSFSESKVKHQTVKRMDSTVLSLVLQELKLMKKTKGSNVYEQTILNNLNSDLHARDHYVFSSLLRDYYIQRSEKEKVVNLLMDLRERYKDHSVLLTEIDYYLSLYN